MKATIEINMDNAAFEGENAGPELADILRKLAGRIEDQDRTYLNLLAQPGARGFFLKDANGNTVGECSLSEPDDEIESEGE